MPKLRRNLGLIEATGLSLSVIAPTMAMAFNVTLAVGVAGVAAPLAFAISTVALVVVGLSFVAFARRVASAGSAFAYITLAFGPRAGFIAGWAMMLSYLAFGAGTAAMVGDFIDAATANYALAVPKLWVAHGTLAILMAILFAYRNMRLAGRLMLALETVSMLAIIVLGVIVLSVVGAKSGLSTAPFAPDKTFGWSGIGYALVFAVLSFAGFEGAATLGEEAGNPNRAIPIAVLGTVGLAGLFYVFASYVQVMGYGLANTEALAHDSAPLNTLARKFGSRDFATALDLAAAMSALSCVVGCLSAAARMLFALGRGGLAPSLGKATARHGTPGAAVLTMGALMMAGALIWAPRIGASNYYGDVGTIGTIALILVYLGVTSAAAVSAMGTRKPIWAAVGGLGTVILVWPLYNSIYPVPAYPGNLWPYVVIIYLAFGLALLALRPALRMPGIPA